jgi:hypothetical protein
MDYFGDTTCGEICKAKGRTCTNGCFTDADLVGVEVDQGTCSFDFRSDDIRDTPTSCSEWLSYYYDTVYCCCM